MAQLFNTQNSTPQSQASSSVPPISPPPPSTPPPPQGQMFHKKSKFAMRTKIFGVLAVMAIIITLPVIVLLSQQQQNSQSSAHTPQPSVSVACQGSGILLTSSYIATQVPDGVTCQIKATDSQNYLTDSFSYKNGDPAHQKTATLNQQTISPGVVTFNTSCSDNFKETNQVSYSLSKPCVTPTPTITPTQKITMTPTPTATPTPTVTPTPTLCVTPGQIQNVKVTCPNCTSSK